MTSTKFKNNETITIVYDDDCPACRNYLQILRIRETVADIEVINAREPHSVVDELSQKGFDLDKGMVVKIAGSFYYGPDAVNKMALLSSPVSLFNKFNYIVFKSPRLSKLVYPILVASRAVLLKVLGVRKIGNLEDK